jgi:signal transduction histidine kinase/integral membrane sensor domain MASE1
MFNEFKFKNIFKTISLNILFISIYFFVSHLCLKFATINSSVSPIWPSTGLAISLLIIFGRKYFIAIFIGAFITNLQVPGPILNALIIAIGNTLEALIGFTIYYSLEKRKKYFNYLSDLTLITTTSLIAPVISASVGVISLLSFGLINGQIAVGVWLTWWIADAIGGMIIIPLVLSIRDELKNKNILELFKLNLKKCIQLAIALCIFLVFYKIIFLEYSLKYIFLIFPFFVLFTYYKSKIIIYLFGFSISVLSIILTVKNIGPFVTSSFNQNLLNLEIFIFTIALLNIVLVGFVKLNIHNKIRVILFGGLLFWGGVFYLLQSKQEQLDEVAFSKITNDYENRIKEKMRDYLQVLMSGRALFMASTSVESVEWQSFVESLDLAKTYEGMNGIGAVFKVNENDKEKYLKNAKKYIDPNFAIKKVPNNLATNIIDASSSYVITYIEPIGPNKAARGLDLGSEFNRRKAADKALFSGSFAISDRIKILQDSQSRFGFLAYLPVYKKNFPTTTSDEREKAFSHWIYAPFITQKFLDSIFLKMNDQKISFKLYDSATLTEENKIYEYNIDSINNIIKNLKHPLILGDKQFYVEWSRNKNYTITPDFLSTWIGLIGIILIIIIILFIINVQSLEVKSKIGALRLNRDFQLSQKKIKEQEIMMVESRRLATLGEMAGSVAHEINNPLAIISGNNQQLKRLIEVLEKSDTKNQILNHIEKIEKTVNRITNIVRGLRLLSRDATNDQMTYCSFPVLLEETLALCFEKFHHSKIELNIESNFQGELYCRGTQISQVLINLLYNAHDAVEALDEKWVKVDIRQVDKSLIVKIMDSGKGIPEELIEKILKPFFTTKDIGKGTGLGLSISNNIVEAHQGSLTIESYNGHTCFKVILPLI